MLSRHSKLLWAGGTTAAGIYGYYAIKNRIPTFTMEQVRQHNNLEEGIWVTYGKNIYNVTDYIDSHPGGSLIMLAAGKSLEPYWKHYPQHTDNKNSYILQDILESRKIGQLSDYSTEKNTSDQADPWSIFASSARAEYAREDPTRQSFRLCPARIVRSQPRLSSCRRGRRSRCPRSAPLCSPPSGSSHQSAEIRPWPGHL